MPPDTSAEPTQLGNYDVVSKIAEGGMGVVYRARHRRTGEVVAVKVISAGTARNPVLLQRFEREFLAARALDHPNVVRALEYSGGPQPFLVMEFVDGESLGQRVERDGPVPEAEAVRLIGQVCDGLQRAHKQGLVHRDVKPDNVLVTRDGVAKLTDMGLVKEVDTDLNLTKTGRGLGTPHYMAPEQFRNAKGVDVRGDIYSVAATLYTLVTGTVPFQNASPLDCWMRKIRNEFPAPKAVVPGLSDRVDWAIRRAMSADPAQRPASCREFVEDLTGQTRGSGPVANRPAGDDDNWYLVYRDDAGEQHTVKGGTAAIRKALADGLLGDAAAVRVGRTKGGQFHNLQSLAEFRDLVVTAAPLAPPGRKSGSVPPPADDDRVDFGTLPPATTPASATGRSARPILPGAGPPSGRYTPSVGPASGKYRPPPAPARTPAPVGDPAAETHDHPTPTPLTAPARRPRQPDPRPDPEPRPGGFDWTPVLVVLVGLLSAAVGFYFFTRSAPAP